MNDDDEIIFLFPSLVSVVVAFALQVFRNVYAEKLHQDERKSTHILSLLIKLNRMSLRRKTYSDCSPVASSFWDCSTKECLRLKADVCN